jgi:RND family efflux transporter MFP subunit
MQSRAMKIFLPIALVLVALAVTVVLIKTRPHAQRQTPPAPRPRVTVMTVDDHTEAVSIRGFGSVKAKRSVTLVPQVSGEIVSKSADFEAGGYFTAGQVLLKIDDTDYRLAVARARADLAQAQVNLARAEEEAQVARSEWETIGSTRLDSEGNPAEPTPLVLHEPQLKLAQAGLEAARAALHQAEVNLGRCTVSAPFDGRVLTADIDAGQYLRSGTAVGAVYATDVAEITVPVPDEELAWITLNGLDRTRPNVVVIAEFAGDSHSWSGHAVRLGGAVDARSRLVPVVV